MFGAHNFSLSRIGVAVTQLIRTITVVGMVISFFWVIVDAFADSRLDTAAEQSAGRPAWRLTASAAPALIGHHKPNSLALLATAKTQKKIGDQSAQLEIRARPGPHARCIGIPTMPICSLPRASRLLESSDHWAGGYYDELGTHSFQLHRQDQSRQVVVVDPCDFDHLHRTRRIATVCYLVRHADSGSRARIFRGLAVDFPRGRHEAAA